MISPGIIEYKEIPRPELLGEKDVLLKIDKIVAEHGAASAYPTRTLMLAASRKLVDMRWNKP